MRRPLSCILLALSAAACAESPITVPTSTRAFEGGHALNASTDEPPRVVTLCKIGPVGTSGTFRIASTGGQLLHGDIVTLAATDVTNPSGCIEVWKAIEPFVAPDRIDTVTIKELSSTGGAVSQEIVTISALDGAAEFFAPTTEVAVRVSYFNAATVIFKNTTIVINEPQGCTPGFWKQAHHLDSWQEFGPNTRFNRVFANAFPGKTLREVLQLRGGGLNALGRHTVAALLNAAHDDVAYGMTVDEVVQAFNQAYAGTPTRFKKRLHKRSHLARLHRDRYEDLKNLFEEYNERGCPLN